MGRLVGGIVLALVLAGAAGVAAALAEGARTDPTAVTIDIHYSRFSPDVVRVPVGVPITIVLRNTDPIDHEWIVGDAGVHERHRDGTEPVHGSRPTEVSIPAGESRTTTVVFAEAGTQSFVCHLPGHEAYGMVGLVEVVAP
jgi:uncharacterized cupredoxin-like copper-binding protein